MEMSLPEQLSEFLSCGIKRKLLDVEEAGKCARQVRCSEDVVTKRRSGQRINNGSTGSPKSNILLSQLLSKQVDNDSPVGEKDLSAIATVTPLMQMLQQCGGAIANGNAKVENLSYTRKLDDDDFGGKKDPDGDASEFVGMDNTARSELLFMDSEIEAVLQGPKVKNRCEENTGENIVDLQKPLEFDVDDGDDEDSKWEDFAGFGRLDKTGDEKNRESTERGDKTTPDLRDDLFPKSDLGSQSEEDKKILAELEEALESSKFTMEDLNSIFILSNSLALEPTTKPVARSTLNVLEEQVSRIDSEDGLDGANGRRHMVSNYRGPGRGEINELALMSEFDDLITAPNGQKYSSQMQECQIPGEKYTFLL